MGGSHGVLHDRSAAARGEQLVAGPGEARAAAGREYHREHPFDRFDAGLLDHPPSMGYRRSVGLSSTLCGRILTER